MNKKGQLGFLAGKQVLMAISLIAGLLTILHLTGTWSLATITGSDQYVERPIFKYVRCDQIDEFSWSRDYNIGESGSWLIPPETSSYYNARISYPSASFGTQNRLIYSICGSRVHSSDNCQPYKQTMSIGTSAGTYEISSTSGSKYVWVQFAKFSLFGTNGRAGSTYKIGHQPYVLREFNVLGGSSALLNGGSCKLNVDLSGQIKSEDIQTISAPAGTVYSTQNQFKPNEIRWYLAGYVTSASEGVDLGDGTWCRDVGSSGKIYNINTVVTDRGTYKIADPDINSFIRNVECCPNDISGSKRCTDDFRWEETENTECSVFNSCGAVDWQPHGANEVIRFSCVRGKCQSQTRAVECSSKYDCMDTLEICNPATWTCVDADVNLDGSEITTIPDNIKDCEERGGKWITKTEEDKSFLNFLGIGDPKIVVIEYCDMSRPNYLLWVALAGVVVLLFFFRGQIIAGFKILGRKIGL